MPVLTVASSTEKYTTSSSWSSGQARQGTYNSSRYGGAIKFSGLSALETSNIAITNIALSLTFGSSGASSTKHVRMYKGTQNDISGSISSMRGALIDDIIVSGAYSSTKTITFNGTTNSDGFVNLRDHIMAGMQTIVFWIANERGTYSGGYSYDYLNITTATIVVTYEFLKSSGSMPSTQINANTNATLNITAYNSSYTHNVTWKFGAITHTHTLSAGETSASYLIPWTWLNQIPTKTSGAASITLETLNAGVSLGTNVYGFTVLVPSTVVPSISSITHTPYNTNSAINGWGIYVKGKSQVNLAITGAAGAYGSTIEYYEITTSPSIGSLSSPSVNNFRTPILAVSGSVTVTAKVRDTRKREKTITTTISSIYNYGLPTYEVQKLCRSNSSGVQDETDGRYIRVQMKYNASDLGSVGANPRNTVSAKVTITQNGGGTIYSNQNISSQVGVTYGNGSNIVTDASYTVTVVITDLVGAADNPVKNTTYVGTINSASYILHVKKGGKALGIGMAAASDNTASFGWKIKLPTTALEVSEGGTGQRSGSAACDALGAVKKSGDTMTGKLRLLQGFDIHRTSGTSGTAGYIRVCRINITAAYMNTPLEIDIAQRNMPASMRLYIRFVNSDNADPAISSFTYTGASSGAYIVKSSASNWDIYVLKSENYDYVNVLDYRRPGMMDGGLHVTWATDQVASLPAGYIQATYLWDDGIVPITRGGTGQTTTTAALGSFMPCIILRNPQSENLVYNATSRRWLFGFNTIERNGTFGFKPGRTDSRAIGAIIPQTGFYLVSFSLHLTDGSGASAVHSRVHNFPSNFVVPTSVDYMLEAEYSQAIQNIYSGATETSSANTAVACSGIMLCQANSLLIPTANVGNVTKVINADNTSFSAVRVG